MTLQHPMMALRIERQIKVYMLIVSVCLGAQTSAAMPLNSTLVEFEQWMARHRRNYTNNLEKAKRYRIFLETLRFIKDFDHKVANRSYKVGLNQFSDLTTNKFVARYTGFRPMSKRSNSSATTTFKYQSVTQVPDSVNWVDQGVVGSIKDQSGCASCLAFSAAAAVELMTAITTGVLLDLSEQQLINCATNGGNHGCKGGFRVDAFEYIIENKGISSEETYPYVGIDGTCDTKAASVTAAQISGYADIPVSEDEILKAVAMQPVSIALDASSDEFKHYAWGVFEGHCGANLNHAAVIVGYRTTMDGVNYWLIKNSWSVKWGEDGYMRILRNSDIRGGLCVLAMGASYPVA